MPERVVVAMSGGVDSSVAAALLVEQGYEVIGVMLRLWSEPLRPTLGGGTIEAATNRCCSVESVHDARGVADKLGIPFYVLNAEEAFEREVVRPFIATYAAGRTPNPCLNCNRKIRFGYLLNYAMRTLGARYLATGHYARIRCADGWPLPALARRGSGQGSILCLERVGPGRPGAGALPGGCVHQAAGARPGRRTGPADGIAGREPGSVLRRRWGLPPLPGRQRAGGDAPRPDPRHQRPSVGRACRPAGLHHRPAGRIGHRRGAAALCSGAGHDPQRADRRHRR